MEIEKIQETIRMIADENLDVRTIIMISCSIVSIATATGPAKRSTTRSRLRPRTWLKSGARSKPNLACQSLTSGSPLPQSL